MPQIQNTTRLDDHKFALLCLKYSPKPDFQAVADATGGTANAAYKRHWKMMKRAAESAGEASPSGRKRLQPTKTEMKREDIDDEDVEDKDRVKREDEEDRGHMGRTSKRFKVEEML